MSALALLSIWKLTEGQTDYLALALVKNVQLDGAAGCEAPDDAGEFTGILTDWPFAAVMTSPASTPAFAAGPSFWGSATNAPCACFKPMPSAISWVTG